MVTIASVYWKELTTTRQYRQPGTRGFHTLYKIAGVPKQGEPPATLAVNGAQELVYRGDGMNTPQLVLPQESEVFATSESESDLSAKLIAGDLVNTWGSVSSGEFGRGVWLCAKALPSREELEENTTRQIEWARELVAHMDQQWMSTRRPASPVYREAAEWLGEQREWQHATVTALLKNCPFCAKPTPTAAPKCQHCGEIHDPERFREIQQGLGGVQETTAKVERSTPDSEAAQAEAAPPVKTRQEVLSTGRGVKHYVAQKLDEIHAE